MFVTEKKMDFLEKKVLVGQITSGIVVEYLLGAIVETSFVYSAIFFSSQEIGILLIFLEYFWADIIIFKAEAAKYGLLATVFVLLLSIIFLFKDHNFKHFYTLTNLMKKVILIM